MWIRRVKSIRKVLRAIKEGYWGKSVSGKIERIGGM